MTADTVRDRRCILHGCNRDEARTSNGSKVVVRRPSRAMACNDFAIDAEDQDGSGHGALMIISASAQVDIDITDIR